MCNYGGYLSSMITLLAHSEHLHLYSTVLGCNAMALSVSVSEAEVGVA